MGFMGSYYNLRKAIFYLLEGDYQYIYIYIYRALKLTRIVDCYLVGAVSKVQARKFGVRRYQAEAPKKLIKFGV